MRKLRVLHVEDDRNTRLMLSDLLGDSVELVSTETAEQGLEACRQQPFDLTLLDWMLPGMDGGQFLTAVVNQGTAGRIVVATAIGTMERAVEAMRKGAYDFLVKPVDPDSLLDLVAKASKSVDLVHSAGRSRPMIERAPASAIVGKSDEVLSLKARLEQVASSPATVLIVGESGTGKELVARALHEASGRHRGRLVTVNCAAIPESLFEAELFGHKRGTFTGATGDRAGLFELANKGTLFLDEVGELAASSQAKLLRVLQEFRVRRIGEDKDRPIDLRVIAATNRDLEQEVERGAFREDLLFRLDVIRLEVPSLRDRRSDIRELLNHFLSLHGTTYQRATPSLNNDHWTKLESHHWPGNIRELENTARRIILLGADAAILELQRRQKPTSTAEVERERSAPSTSEVLPLKDVVRQATREAIVRALKVSDGSRTQAAALLGVSRKTLFNKMQDLGIREESKWT